MQSKWAEALGQEDEDTWWCDKCVKYHRGQCWIASKDEMCMSSRDKPWCETCSKRHYGECWLLKGTKKGKGTGSTDKGADDTGKGKSAGSAGKSTGSTGKGTGSTGKSTGSAGSGASKDGRNAISLVYRSVKLSCKHAGGSQELAPRVIAMVRDVQHLEHQSFVEVLAATETYLQQVQTTRLSLQTIMEEWTAQASQSQRDELVNFVAHALPKMLDEARASTQS